MDPQSIHSTLNASESLKPHPEYYFPDGNIVLLAGSSAFRVHSFILARRSDLFRDLFDIPQPQDDEYSYDGCTVVHLSDSAKEIDFLLFMMYDGGRSYFSAAYSLSFAQVAMMLHLGTKYQMEDVREEAISRLWRCYPSHLPHFDNEVTRRDSIYDAHPFDAIRLAHRFGLDFILPPAYYLCTRMGLDTMVKAARKGWWNFDDLRICMKARKKLRTAEIAANRSFASYLESWSNIAWQTVCINPTVCNDTMRLCINILKWCKYNTNRGLLVNDLNWCLYIASRAPLCYSCIALFGHVHDVQRSKIWSELGQYCNVPNWSSTSIIRRCALGDSRETIVSNDTPLSRR
ncbi:unnamed protein product [Somion occarium]|uniref:BTB domain-containing protein n=1 Tax=Somion occarium TaxID=3059160 RepID=A0ABP1EB60_9APHY